MRHLMHEGTRGGVSPDAWGLGDVSPEAKEWLERLQLFFVCLFFSPGRKRISLGFCKGLGSKSL